MSAGTTHFSIEGNSINVVSMVDFWTGGSGPKIIWLSAAALPDKNWE